MKASKIKRKTTSSALPENQIILLYVIIFALMMNVMGGLFDVWWLAVGAGESPWAPPRFFIYFGTGLALCSGLYAWYLTRSKVWRRLAIALALIFLSSPVNEIWHNVVGGPESAANATIVWSPAHLMAILAIIASLVIIVPMLKFVKDSVARRFFTAIVFAGILAMTTIFLIPLEPTGAYHILDFWGAGIIAFLFVLILFTGRSRIAGIGALTLIIVFFSFLQAIRFGEHLQGQVLATDADIHVSVEAVTKPHHPESELKAHEHPSIENAISPHHPEAEAHDHATLEEELIDHHMAVVVEHGHISVEAEMEPHHPESDVHEHASLEEGLAGHAHGVVPLHNHPPGWLSLFAFLFPALLIDLIRRRIPLWLAGGLWALGWSGIMYAFSSAWFEPAFVYSLTEGIIAVASATVGGIAAGFVLTLILKKRPNLA